MDKVGLPEYMRELAKTLKFGEDLLLKRVASLEVELGELQVKQQDEIDQTQHKINTYESLSWGMRGLSGDLLKEFPCV